MLLLKIRKEGDYMTEHKTTEARRRASKKYDQNNPEFRQYRNKKSATKNFILSTANEEDLQLVKQWLSERLQQDDNS